jgi:predicted transcriptional regulator
MMIDLALINWDYVISIVISFSVTATFMAIYDRRSSHTQAVNVSQPMLEAIVAEYSHRLKYIEKMVVELRVQVDNLELRGAYQSKPHSSEKGSDTGPESYNQSMMSQQLSQLQMERNITPTPTEQAGLVIQSSASINTKSSMQDIQNGTMDYVLKLLTERPRTSREIQHSIGRTREHTSRLLKRLYESRLVDRQSNSGPYKYTITEAGRIKLNVQSKGDNTFERQNNADVVAEREYRPQHNEEYQR